MDVEERNAERQQHLEKLTSTAVEHLAEQLAAEHSEDYLKLLSFWSRMYRYSAKNTLLILLQKPTAHAVASYTRWKQLGRQVAKGSQAAFIYAPITKLVEQEGTKEKREHLIGWRLVPVFSDQDLTDINENPLPSLWHPLPHDCEALYTQSVAALTSQGIVVLEQKLPKNVQGKASKAAIVIATGLDSTNRFATLLHEASHYFAHLAPEEDKSTQQCELEAEGACYVLLHRLGIEYPFARDYLLSFKVTQEMLHESFKQIGKIVRRLSSLIDLEGPKEKEVGDGAR